MKKLALFVMLMSLGMFSLGCSKPEEPAAPPADADAAAPAEGEEADAPAEGEEADAPAEEADAPAEKPEEKPAE